MSLVAGKDSFCIGTWRVWWVLSLTIILISISTCCWTDRSSCPYHGGETMWYRRASRYRAERNFWLSLFTLVLWLLVYKIYSLNDQIMKLKQGNGDGKKTNKSNSDKDDWAVYQLKFPASLNKCTIDCVESPLQYRSDRSQKWVNPNLLCTSLYCRYVHALTPCRSLLLYPNNKVTKAISVDHMHNPSW